MDSSEDPFVILIHCFIRRSPMVSKSPPKKRKRSGEFICRDASSVAWLEGKRIVESRYGVGVEFFGKTGIVFCIAGVRCGVWEPMKWEPHRKTF